MPSKEQRKVTITDGSLDWTEGVNSDVVTTIQSERNPNGLKRTQVSWMDNATVRGGGILQRSGWLKNGAIPIVGQFMGQFMYEPDEGFPYLIMVIDGHVWKVDPTNPSAAIDLTTAFSNPGSTTVITGLVTVTLMNVDDHGIGHTVPAGTEPTIGAYSSFVVPYINHTVVVAVANPYLGALGVNITLNSHTYQITAASGFTITVNPGIDMSLPVTDLCYFVQAEQFLVIQNGDFVTNPLIWDGSILRRSIGITNGAVAPGTPGVNEIPPAGPMVYYMDRLWYAQGRTVSAGDIVGGGSGTLAYGFRDAVLNVTENPLCVGGDGFTVPTTAGNIRGLAFASNLNTQLGQGALYIGTRKEIYALTVPVTRTNWIAANTNNGPLMVVALENNGWVNDRSIVAVNGDLFFQSLEPGIRSLTTAVRNFQQWGNVPISVNENRLLQFVDRALMKYGSGIYFDNRLLQATLPFVCPVGVAHKAILPLNFDTISTFERQLPPCWEGMLEGLNVLELSVADFGGRERAFASAWSDVNQTIQVWELTKDFRWENDGNTRVSWYVEFPAYTWGNELELKKLVGGELWLDKLLGEVVFKMEYRPDGDPCWYPWHQWKFCTAKDSCETVHNPVCVYPAEMRESYRQMVTLPVPPLACEAVMGRPSNIGYQFQTKLTVLGWVRIRGLLLHAEPVERKLYDNLVCAKEEEPSAIIPQPIIPPAPPGAPCVITSSTPMAGGTVGIAYDQQVEFSGGTGTLIFKVDSGALPDGLAMSNTGLITGIPTTANTFSFTVLATDASGISCSKELSISIDAAPATGYMICDWATVLGQLNIIPGVYDALCGVSVLPAWDGIFDQSIAKTTLEPVWYFIGQSIGAVKFSADESPTYPAAGWQDASAYTRLEWNTGSGSWFLRITCAFGLDNWLGGSLGGGIGDPSGVYTRIGGDSANPATITVVVNGHPEDCPA